MALDFKKYTSNGWLKGESLEEGEKLILTVKKAYEHTFPSGDTTPVIEFLEIDEKLSLNRTRIGKMCELLGDDSDEWSGRQIALYPVDVNFNGKTVASVAIAAATRKKARPIVEDDNVDVEFSSR